MGTVTAADAAPLARVPAGAPMIDADVHANVPAIEALVPFLSEEWREYVAITGFKGPGNTSYPPGSPTSLRPDLAAHGGPAAGTTLASLQRNVLDTWRLERAILNCYYAVESLRNPDAAAALATAVNEWLREEWVDRDSRLRASMVVPIGQPQLAAREIERIGGHPGFVQVLLPVRSEAPYGNRRYHPVFEAASKHGLVVGLHFGGAPGNPPTGAGWPSFYLEEHVGMAAVFQTQVMSVVTEGVFDAWPDLRVALVESGFAWVPGFLWRFDKEWKGLRREVPWTRRLPSDYVRDHVRFTLHPIDVSDSLGIPAVLDQLGSDELLMFSTDYPHWHYDDPTNAVPASLDDDLLRKVLGENARSFYRL